MCIMIDDDHRGEIEARVAEATSLVFYVDFDGTLAPIVADPGLASLSPETRAVLEEFSSREDVLIAVVSGRSLADVKSRVGLQSLVYSGDHGLQIEGHSLRFEHPEAARCRDALAELNQQLIGLPAALAWRAGRKQELDHGNSLSTRPRWNARASRDDPAIAGSRRSSALCTDRGEDDHRDPAPR